MTRWFDIEATSRSAMAVQALAMRLASASAIVHRAVTVRPQ
jgi:hypothetical protein